MGDYGINIYPEKNDPTAAEFIMTTKYPMAKLDSQNESSLKTIQLTFLTEPPLNTITQVYQYAHGYDYTPQFWTLFNFATPPPNAVTVEAYSNVNSAQASIDAFNFANFFVGVDETNFYIAVSTVYDGTPPSLTLTGTVLKVTTYAFVDELLIT